MLRLNQCLAFCGIASRRKADLLIQQGHVFVNGKICCDLSTKITLGKDRVFFKKKMLSFPTFFQYYVLYKPAGCLSAKGDSLGRRTIYDCFQKLSGGIFHVGRLDYDVGGILLLMNDGQLGHRLLHPRYEVGKIYYVELDGYFSSLHLNSLLLGIPMREGVAKAYNVQILNNQRDISSLRFTLKQGFNRQIKRMFQSLGLKILYLRRESFAGIAIASLKPGDYRSICSEEVKLLKEKVGLL